MRYTNVFLAQGRSLLKMIWMGELLRLLAIKSLTLRRRYVNNYIKRSSVKYLTVGRARL